jgi:hypothetical protein|tara:strand:- start:93 stop:506 length:414 start_codon:yes stop_codon:yes gene_type:complete
MSLFSSIEKCKQCGDCNGLSDYNSYPVTKSRVIPADEVKGQSTTDQVIGLKNGEKISPHFSIKMGPWYFYWIEMNKRSEHKICSRKCASEYAKKENTMLMEKNAGSLNYSNIILPHQLEIDQYKYDNNISDKGLSTY